MVIISSSRLRTLKLRGVTCLPKVTLQIYDRARPRIGVCLPPVHTHLCASALSSPPIKMCQRLGTNTRALWLNPEVGTTIVTNDHNGAPAKCQTACMCFVHINSFNPHNDPGMWVLFLRLGRGATDSRKLKQICKSHSHEVVKSEFEPRVV